MSISIHELHPSVGVEIGGVDLSKPVPLGTVAEIREAWGRHGVLVFRDQDISDPEHVAFARNFGDLEVLPERDYTDGRLPEIFKVSNIGDDGKLLPTSNESATFNTLTWFWHTDSCYRPIPSRGAILHGIEVIQGGGGETRFANLRAALAEMPAALRARIEGRSARHNFAYMRTHRALAPMKPEEAASVPPVHHKLIRTHEDGSQSLYISPVYMEKISGLDDADAKALVEELAEWSSQDRFVYEHSWRPHDVVMWDNTWTMHLVMPYDNANQRRRMHRTAIAGSEAVL
jgi:alpha-ketoglutarate-dependent taurine dioxygenase